jgi:hypothetical protein
MDATFEIKKTRMADARGGRIRVRVARWYIYMQKVPIWVYSGGPWKGNCWYVLWTFGIHMYVHIFTAMSKFFGLLVYKWTFGIFSPFWNVVPRKIWQP